MDADYHLGEKNNHKYFCGKHWWEYVIQARGMDDVRYLVYDGVGKFVDKG